VALLGAVVTATYIFRAIFIVFLGAPNTEISGAQDWRIVLPLGVLAMTALGIGWLETPDWLGGHRAVSGFLATAMGGIKMLPGPNIAVQLAGVVAPLFGLGLAYTGWRSGLWGRVAQAQNSPVRDFAKAGFGFDTVYDALFTRPFLALARWLRNDPVDLVFVGIARAMVAVHTRLRGGQTGQLRRYAGWMMAGSVAVVALAVFL
jgi:NADH-quinone oxidoreductase subunit L